MCCQSNDDDAIKPKFYLCSKQRIDDISKQFKCFVIEICSCRDRWPGPQLDNEISIKINVDGSTFNKCLKSYIVKNLKFNRF